MFKEHFLNRIKNKNPQFFDVYNYHLVPDEFEEIDKVTIECKRHGEFKQKAAQHMFGAGCISCTLEKAASSTRKTTEWFVNESKSRFGEMFLYDKTTYVKKGVPLTITCKAHGDFVVRPEQHFWLDHGCPKCTYEIPRASKKLKFIEQATGKHSGRYDYSKVEFISVNHHIEIVCPTHGSFWQKAVSHYPHGQGCPNCAIDKGKVTLDEFVARARKVHGDRYSYERVSYNRLQDKVTITCKKHGDFVQRAGSHLSGCRCKFCYIDDNLLQREVFIENAKVVHGDRFDYSKAVYLGSKKRVEIICPDHGSFWQNPNTHVSGRTGCKLCSESKGERIIALLLQQYKIPFVREYRLSPLKLRADFYLQDYGIYIEYNGHQHYRPVELFGGKDAFFQNVRRDKLKLEYIQEKGENLIVIPYVCSDQASVEKLLVRKMKEIIPRWYRCKGSILVFKRTKDVYESFNIPKTVSVNDIDEWVVNNNPDVELVFNI